MADLGLPLKIQNFEPRYNVAPGAGIMVLFNEHEQVQAEMMEWGIVPAWAKPDKPMRPLINARAETVWEKPSFKHNIKSRRAIVPANGFYEWHRTGGTKTPFYVAPAQGKVFAFGAIYQTSRDGIKQCCLLTTTANPAMAEVHDRMPVILTIEQAQEWMCCDERDRLDELMRACNDEIIQITQVSSYVNSSRQEGPRCIEAV